MELNALTITLGVGAILVLSYIGGQIYGKMQNKDEK